MEECGGSSRQPEEAVSTSEGDQSPGGDDDGQAAAAADTELGPLTLDTIPVEVLLQIFNFVDATDLLRKVSLVSKYFHGILSNEMTWKIKQEKRWGGSGPCQYPPIDLFEENQDTTDTASTDSSTYYSNSFTPSTFPWSRACVKREEQIKLWSSLPDTGSPASTVRSSSMVHTQVNSHIGCIDSVHLFLRGDTMMLACGSRDRTISLWNVETMLREATNNCPTNTQQQQHQSSKLKILNRAHDGWIWDFGVNSKQLVSCSWDTSAKAWDFYTFQSVGEFRATSALLSTSSTESLVSLGSFNRKVYLLDPRQFSKTQKPIHTYTPHTRSVLSVGLDSNFVISCGEDGLCVKHDLRSQKTLSTFKLSPTDSVRNPYPTCMSFRETTINLPYFYVGDNTGTIHLVDLLQFRVVDSYKLHNAPVRGVFHNLGSVVSCSRDGKLLVRDPCLGMKCIGDADVGDKIELPCVHSLNNVVACGGGDGIVRVWGETLN